MHHTSIPSRNAPRRTPVPEQQGERESLRDPASQLRPTSNATQRSVSPYRELWQLYPPPEPDLIDLGTPHGSVSDPATVGPSRDRHDSSKRYSNQHLNVDSWEPVFRPQRSSTAIRPQESLLDLDVAPSKQQVQIDTKKRICEDCEMHKSDLAYCNICQYVFCGKCWARQITHRGNQVAPGDIPHEKTNYEVASKIKQVLESNMTESEQKHMHSKDENSTWFGILREKNEIPIFQDYGRYAQLMSDIASRDPHGAQETRYPGVVSFVGQTGAGKSTLIKLIIDLNTQSPEEFPTPIVGSVKNQDLPTSGDVHLYADPRTFSLNTPLLYADCEGLEGGEREPISARFKKSTHKFTGIGYTSSFEKRLKKTRHTSEREITWANTSKTRSREFAVTNLYPRLLYTFSDVVVFVLKNPRTIESVFEKLVDWAAAALEKSSNQPVLPHAIIVLNASENSTQPDLWDIDVATETLLQSLSQTVFQNDKFKEYALFWRERQRQIDNVQDLLLSYYSSLKVVRIPTNGRPNLICDQIQKLYSCIEDACDQSRERKGHLRMLLDADELQPYLQAAFDHFACDLDTPFDFVQAAFINSPIPLDFGGNILKLAINLMDAWQNIASGSMIFTELSYMVSSCIMLDSARHGIKGTAEQIFPQYIEHLDAALENFCDRHWPCEFVKSGSNGGRCVNVRSGHGSKGHQLKNGKVLAVGEYVSQFSFASHQEAFQFDVYFRLIELLHMLRMRTQDLKEVERVAAASIHRETVMHHFFAHSTRGQPDAYISHSACFTCLFEPPEHGLPCGHVICTKCLRDFSSRIVWKTVIEIDSCPICNASFVWKVVLKPDAAGLRILTLDGGGIRGIVELEILRQIELAMKNVPLNSFFDLIVGTSTGGIIALGLGAKNWSVEYCIQTFEDLCARAFTARIGSGIPGVGWLIENYNHSKYETQPLQEALMEAYSETEYLFGGVRSKDLFGSNTKVAVTSTSTAGCAVVLANYNRICRSKLSYQFQRAEKLGSELKTWEAARATSAAPRIFKPMCHDASKQVYTDGGLYHNNPIKVADQERKLIWPYLADDPPDIILSIGTSYNSLSARPKPLQPPSAPRRGIINHGKQLLKILMDCVASTLDSERVWNDYVDGLNLSSRDAHRYVRLNPDLLEDPPTLDQVDKIEYIRNIVRRKMRVDERIGQVALQLIATSFYFETTGQIEALPDGGFECRGHIYCRLLPGSEEMMKLGKYMKFQATKTDPYFLIQEEHRAESAKRVAMAHEIIERMIRERQFIMKAFSINISGALAHTDIRLCLKPELSYPISRFPRSLLQEDASSGEGTRPTIATSSIRWAGRSSSQRHRRKWTTPDLRYIGPQPDVISLYSSPDYVIGNSSVTALSVSASRLSHDSRAPASNWQHTDVPPLVQLEPAEMDGITNVYEMSA